MKHLLSLEKLARADFDKILHDAAAFKRERGHHKTQPLAGQTWALMFSKSSTRTRVSFEVGIHELGGYAINLDGKAIGLGSRESVEDVAKLLSRYNDAIVARLHEHSIIEGIAEHASIPVINALTDLSHPCQVLADAFTLYEKSLWNERTKVVFVGDGNNVANSWIELAGLLPFHFVLACPEGYTPDAGLLEAARAKGLSRIELVLLAVQPTDFAG